MASRRRVPTHGAATRLDRLVCELHQRRYGWGLTGIRQALGCCAGLISNPPGRDLYRGVILVFPPSSGFTERDPARGESAEIILARRIASSKPSSRSTRLVARLARDPVLGQSRGGALSLRR